MENELMYGEAFEVNDQALDKDFLIQIYIDCKKVFSSPNEYFRYRILNYNELSF